MKKIILILSAIVIVSCGDMHRKNSYNYEITYTDGTKESVTTRDKIEFDGNNGCIKTCGCSDGKLKRCGVRKFEEVNDFAISSKEVESRVTDPNNEVDTTHFIRKIKS